MTLSYITYISQKIKVNFTKLMYFFYSLLLIFLISCSSLKKGNESQGSKTSPVSAQDISLFEKAFNDLGNKKHSSAIPIFEKLAKKYRGQDLEWTSLYNLASAYKELNQCEKAESIYQKLMPLVDKHLPLKSHIYLSLSYVYECLGQFENTLITLKEGLQYSTPHSKDINLIEYPARLALAYIRMDEDKTGLKLQKTLYANMEVIKKTFRISSAADKNFSRYFYIIGRSHINSSYIKLPSFLKMLSYYQTYLTQSILLNIDPWSDHSQKELENIYFKMWLALKKERNKKIYNNKIKKNLKALKNIADSSKNKTLLSIYTKLQLKTLSLLEN